MIFSERPLDDLFCNPLCECVIAMEISVHVHSESVPFRAFLTCDYRSTCILIQSSYVAVAVSTVARNKHPHYHILRNQLRLSRSQWNYVTGRDPQALRALSGCIRCARPASTARTHHPVRWQQETRQDNQRPHTQWVCVGHAEADCLRERVRLSVVV